MITLSGTIDASDITDNFNEEVANIYDIIDDAGSDFQYDLQTLDLTTALGVGYRVFDFTPTADLQLLTIGLSVFNPDATSRTATLTLTAITDGEAAVSKYLVDQTISVSVTATTAAEYNATRVDYKVSSRTTPFITLVKGITYRMTIARTDANAGVIDRAYGFVLCRGVKRYK